MHDRCTQTAFKVELNGPWVCLCIVHVTYTCVLLFLSRKFPRHTESSHENTIQTDTRYAVDAEAELRLLITSRNCVSKGNSATFCVVFRWNTTQS